MNKILYLPLDERPCNFDFAARIAEIADDIRLVRPPREIMGNKKIPANSEEINAFLKQNALGSKACIISLDTLLYGGIVPSRLHSLCEEELENRLSVLRQLKRTNPDIKIYAFALIMRCPSYSSSDEEPDYYEHCGREIFLYGQLKHKYSLGLVSEDEYKTQTEKLNEKIKDAVSDYEDRRAKNLSMLLKIVRLVGNEIDFLVIPQDDSSPYGYTTADREKLKAAIKEEGLENVAMYPGADEVGMTLLARAVNELHGKVPSVSCIYAADGAENVIPLYEDRPLKDTLVFQIETAGCRIAESGDRADIKLYLNYPSGNPVNVGEKVADGYAARDIKAFSEAIAKDVYAGEIVALADGAYCNGGDTELIKQLSNNISLFSLCAYAGWNTSSNTLGTAICQAVITKLYKKNGAANRFLAERFYEDIGYCAHTRGYMCSEVLPKTRYGYFDAGERNGEVAALVRKETEEYMRLNFPEVYFRYTLDKCELPWARMFETDMTVKEKPAFKDGRRGVWHRPDDTGEEHNLEGMLSVLDKFKKAGINTVFLESFYHGMAMYRSEYVPYYSGFEKFDYGGYSDYLTAFVAEAGKRGIEVHAWVEDFYIGINENYFTENHRDWLLVTDGGNIRQTEGDGFLFLDPANVQVCKFLTGLYLEMLSKVKGIKGLNLDYIRYPLSSEEDDTGYTEAAMRVFAANNSFGYKDRKQFKQALKRNNLFGEWIKYRADAVTDFVSLMRGAVKKKFPHILFSTAIFPEKELSYKTKKQDFTKWLERGYLDVVTPMAYYDDINTLKAALKEMSEYCACVCLAGLSCTYHSLSVGDMFGQIAACKEEGADGFVFFGSKSLLENPEYIAALNEAYVK